MQSCSIWTSSLVVSSPVYSLGGSTVLVEVSDLQTVVVDCVCRRGTTCVMT